MKAREASLHPLPQVVFSGYRSEIRNVHVSPMVGLIGLLGQSSKNIALRTFLARIFLARTFLETRCCLIVVQGQSAAQGVLFGALIFSFGLFPKSLLAENVAKVSVDSDAISIATSHLAERLGQRLRSDLPLEHSAISSSNYAAMLALLEAPEHSTWPLVPLHHPISPFADPDLCATEAKLPTRSTPLSSIAVRYERSARLAWQESAFDSAADAWMIAAAAWGGLECLETALNATAYASWALERSGDLEFATVLIERARVLSRRIDRRGVEAPLAARLGRLWILQEQWNKARITFEDAVSLSSVASEKISWTIALGLARTYAGLKLPQADAFYQAAVSSVVSELEQGLSPIDAPWFAEVPSLFGEAAQRLFLAGRPTEALVVAERGKAVLDAIPMRLDNCLNLRAGVPSRALPSSPLAASDLKKLVRLSGAALVSFFQVGDGLLALMMTPAGLVQGFSAEMPLRPDPLGEGDSPFSVELFLPILNQMIPAGRHIPIVVSVDPRTEREAARYFLRVAETRSDGRFRLVDVVASLSSFSEKASGRRGGIPATHLTDGRLGL